MIKIPPVVKSLLLAFLVLLTLLGLARVTYLWAQEEYTIYLSTPLTTAASHAVTGRFDTVADVLAAAGISLHPADYVTPALDAPPQAETAIVVQKALSITLQTDDDRQLFWTHQPTVSAFLAEIHRTVQRTDRIFADNQPVAFNALSQTPLPSQLDIRQFLTVTILDAGRELVIRTAAQTVGQALRDANITVYAADGVMPALGQWLTPNTVITVRRSMPLTILADGRTIQTRSHHTNVLRVLSESGIGLVGEDFTRPGADVALSAGQTIEVIRVTYDFRVEDQPIPYETLWQATDRYEIDTIGLLQAGAPGIRRQRIRVRYENGVAVSQTPDGEWVALAPIPEIIGYGTQIVVRVLNTPTGPIEYWRKVRMRVTSYTEATSGKSPNHPTYGITASGLRAGTGIVAIDRAIVPWRSSVYVEGYGIGVAGDTGGGVKGRWIDLGYNVDSYIHWSGYTDVYYLTPVPPPDQINYLLPTWLP